MHDEFRCHCCPGAGHDHTPRESLVNSPRSGLSRRLFLAGAAASGVALSSSTWNRLAAAAEHGVPMPSDRKTLVVKPILAHELPRRAEMRSWRHWGGIQTQEQAQEEVARITAELVALKKSADFPVEFLPLSAVTDIRPMKDAEDVRKADVVILYGAGHSINGIQDFGRDVIVFQRWKSGPVYLQYEIVSPRFLRQHTDTLQLTNITFDDVVTDDLDELTWRLRSLCGLKNARGTKILCIGGPAGWSQPAGVVPALVEKVWGYDMVTVTYDELGSLIEAARHDEKTVALARTRAKSYLACPGTSLETNREFVDNCFLLDLVFRNLMREADCRALTINGCMGTIMPKAKTAACLTLSTLNDDGYLAFCESDFVVIPSGVLLANITGTPVFLNDPTYPNHQIITLAHCTGPRRMNGKDVEPARIVTHFESDYGAAPKVEWPKGQVVTCIAPDFKSERWMGLLGRVADSPFRDICRDQIDVEYAVPDALVAARMPGFHWMTCYGDYRREIGYAIRRVGITWDNLDEVPTA